MPSRLWTEEAECWGPALPCPQSFGSERRHGVLVVCAERDCRGPGSACVHCGPWPCGWDVQRCPATGQPCSASRCVLCRGITSDGRTCDRTAPPCSRSSTESARAASQGSEGPSVGL